MSFIPITNNPVWIKIATKTHTDFSTAGLVNTIASGYLLPANACINGCFVNATAAFTGSTISAYTISVGVGSGANIAKYCPALSVFTVALQLPRTLAGIESLSTTTSITLTATSIGANLSAATTGSVDIYLLVGLI